jgi:hypothetical protein
LGRFGYENRDGEADKREFHGSTPWYG